MSDADDALIGRLMSRREVLALFGLAGAALVVGCSDGGSPERPTSAATASGETPTVGARPTAAAASSTRAVPACVVVPELTEGPYFVDEKLNRTDIRSDPATGNASDGDQLDLAVLVSQVGADGGCAPLPGAQIDVWQCDALGIYSDVTDIAGAFDTRGQKFLRGYQLTDVDGRASFTTVYPGWYQGRATHIHFKVRAASGHEFTSQWFFDDALSDRVHAQGAYAAKGAAGRTPNGADGIFRDSNGMLTLDVVRAGARYAATFDIGLRF
ncbi:MAG TPA: intradiol ring-cleavage dioxygenase [Dehalococcoidia bacterium]|nr:intradiol ring-cleavage dioxygenase [Dehalococcoidia bacterium]